MVSLGDNLEQAMISLQRMADERSLRDKFYFYFFPFTT